MNKLAKVLLFLGVIPPAIVGFFHVYDLSRISSSNTCIRSYFNLQKADLNEQLKSIYKNSFNVNHSELKKHCKVEVQLEKEELFILYEDMYLSKTNLRIKHRILISLLSCLFLLPYMFAQAKFIKTNHRFKKKPQA